MRGHIDVLNLCEKLIASQEQQIKQHDAEHPDRLWSTSSLSHYTTGRREAWEQIIQYCAREALADFDQQDRDLAAKLRKLADEED